MLFLPFEQRMTRDMKAMRERRAARRSLASQSGKSSLSGLTGGQASYPCQAEDNAAQVCMPSRLFLCILSVLTE